MNRLPLKGLQKVVGHSKPKFYIYCWLFKLWCCCPLYAGQPKNSRGPNKGLPRSELGVLILTVFFCHLLYSYTIVLLYYCTIVLPVFFYRQLSDPKLPLGSRSSSRQPEAKSRQQSTFRCPVLHSFYRIFFQIFFSSKVTEAVNIPLSCLTIVQFSIFFPILFFMISQKIALICFI